MSWQTYDKDYITNNMQISSAGCWEWQMQLDNKGYGRVGRGSGEVLAHRLSWRLFKGDTEGLHVLHDCDNPRCCNPEHLFLGTQADNVADAIAKGRHNQSPESTKAAIEANKIPTEKRLGIIEMAKKGYKTSTIAHLLDVSIRTVSRVKKQEGLNVE